MFGTRLGTVIFVKVMPARREGTYASNIFMHMSSKTIVDGLVTDCSIRISQRFIDHVLNYSIIDTIANISLKHLYN